jgi:hypothetical protein
MEDLSAFSARPRRQSEERHPRSGHLRFPKQGRRRETDRVPGTGSGHSCRLTRVPAVETVDIFVANTLGEIGRNVFE